MRITGGEARGRIIEAPPGLEVRPTASKIRQAIFNIIGGNILEADFLDLFAGSGLMGIEALSRGAGSLTSVEKDRKTGLAIEANVRKLKYSMRLHTSDVREILPNLQRQFDIIFADPPYQSEGATKALALVSEHSLLREGGMMAIEHARSLALPETVGLLERYDCRTYGQTAVSFYRVQETP